MNPLRADKFYGPLERARKNANLGLPVAAKTRFRLLKRLVARATWLTNRQQVAYNKSMLQALEGGMDHLASLIDTNTAALLRNHAALEASLRSEVAASLLGNARRDRALGQLRAEFDGAPLEQKTRQRVDGGSDHELSPTVRGGLEESGLSFGAFADRFRGSRELIIERQRPLLAEVVGMPGPLLDLGCGRGEWLELAQEAQLEASGIDGDSANVRRCQEQGLRASEGEILAHLRGLAPESLGAITAFHIVEHLDFADFVEVLREAHRVLRPGGKLLIETPNTANVLVGASTFHLDPGHILPLHPLLIEFVLDAVGFQNVTVQSINPAPTITTPPDGPAGLHEVITAVNAYLFSGQDTLAIGSKQPSPDLR